MWHPANCFFRPNKIMPGYKRKRTFKGRKSRKSRKSRAVRRYRPRLNRIGSVTGMPQSRVTSMRYAELLNVTSTTGIVGAQVYRANSLFDPNFSLGGHQPIGYDLMTQQYNHYCVIGSKITATVTDASDSKVNPQVCGIVLTDEATVPYANINSYIESKKGTWRAIQGGASRPTTVKSWFSAKKFFNIKDVKDNVGRIGAGIGSNPTEGSYYVFWTATQNGTTNTFYVQFVIDYTVLWFEPKDAVES